MRDVMIDLETFGNGRHAMPVQLGGVFFDRETGELGHQFKRNIDASTAKAFCDIDASTVYWWLEQDGPARASILAQPRCDFRKAMKEFREFLNPAECVWSHATFDFVIVQESLKALGLKTLYYRSARDIRTLVDLSAIDTKMFIQNGVAHDALDDAKFQVKYCVEALKALGVKR